MKARNTADPAEKVSLYRRTAEIKETGLDVSDEAFEYYGKALREAVGLPELTDVMSALERLAEENDRWKDLVEIYRVVSNDILDLRIQEKMRLTVADVARHRLGDKDTAREFYREVLESAPDSLRALEALESLYAETEDYEPLLGILKTRADFEVEDEGKRRDYLARAAILCDEVPGDDRGVGDPLGACIECVTRGPAGCRCFGEALLEGRPLAGARGVAGAKIGVRGGSRRGGDPTLPTW